MRQTNEQNDPPMVESAQKSSLLIYDGHCRLCRSLVRRLQRLDGMKEASLLPSQSAAGQEALRSAGMTNAALDTIVLIASDGVHVKSDAVLTLLRRSRWGRVMAAIMQLFPRRLRDKVYDIIAARRYTVFGRIPVCDRDRCRQT